MSAPVCSSGAPPSPPTLNRWSLDPAADEGPSDAGPATSLSERLRQARAAASGQLPTGSSSLPPAHRRGGASASTTGSFPESPADIATVSDASNASPSRPPSITGAAAAASSPRLGRSMLQCHECLLSPNAICDTCRGMFASQSWQGHFTPPRSAATTQLMPTPSPTSSPPSSRAWPTPRTLSRYSAARDHQQHPGPTPCAHNTLSEQYVSLQLSEQYGPDCVFGGLSLRTNMWCV